MSTRIFEYDPTPFESDKPFVPFAEETLSQVLCARGSDPAFADKVHVVFLDRTGEECRLTFAQLLEECLSLAGALRQRGVTRQQPVLLSCVSNRQFVLYFYACQLLAAVPIPITPPLHRTQVPLKLVQLEDIARAGGIRTMLTDRRLQDVYLGGLPSSLMREVIAFEDLEGERSPVEPDPGTGEDLAFIQYTSGSTGGRKAVPLTHRHLRANINAIGRGLHIVPEDCGVSFLPVYHDMGLIGKVLLTACHGNRLVLIPPLDFLRAPGAWLRAVHDYSGTVCAAPPFAYGLCTRRIEPKESEGMRLDSWRIAMIAADMIRPHDMASFIDRFADSGLRPDVFLPVYGLAESTLATTFPPLTERLHTMQQSIPESDEPRTLVGVGRPVEGVELAIRTVEGEPVPDGHEGEIVIRGTSVIDGYWKSEDSPLRDGWLRTGDLGIWTEDGLFISGRIKDALKYHGRTLQPSDIEWAAERVQGVRRGSSAAFNASRSDAEVIVVVESRVTERADREALRDAVRAAVIAAHGVSLHDVVVVPPRVVPKTTSGKVQRYLTRQRYEAGTLVPTVTSGLKANLSTVGSIVRGKIKRALGAGEATTGKENVK